MEERLNSLVDQLKAGNQTAAAEFVDLYYRQIYLFLRKLGHDHRTSEDLTQESFIQAWRHVGQLRNAQALRSWLYRLACNESRRYWRRHKKNSKEVLGFEGLPLLKIANGSERGAEQLEQLGRLKAAVDRLPLKLKQDIILHYMEQLTIAEVARAVGVGEGTLKSRINRALRALREQASL